MKINVKVGDELLDVTVQRRDGVYKVEVGETTHRVDVHKLEGDFYSIVMEGRSYEVSVEATRAGYVVRHGAAEQAVALSDAGRRGREALRGPAGPEQVVSMMPGKVVRLLVEPGDTVEPGQGLVVVEAMKMENEISATRGGRVASIAVQPDQAVEGGAELLVIE